MSNELRELWKKRGITPQGGVQPKVEQKKAPGTFVPMAMQNAPDRFTNPPSDKGPTAKRKTANEEMREIMEKKAGGQSEPEPPKPSVKQTSLNEMQEAMQKKQEADFQPKEVHKKKTAKEEMEELMQGKKEPRSEPIPFTEKVETSVKQREIVNVVSQPRPEVKKSEVKRATAADEMKNIMQNRGADFAKPKDEPKRKTANEEMQEIMKSKDKQPAPAVLPPKEKRTYLEEMKQTVKGGAPAPNLQQEIPKTEIESHKVQGVKSIEEDDKMKQIRALLESQIKFTSGDTLELKPKPPAEEIPTEEVPQEAPAEAMPEPEQQLANPVYESAVQPVEGNAEREDEDSDEPKDSADAPSKPTGLFSDD